MTRWPSVALLFALIFGTIGVDRGAASKQLVIHLTPAQHAWAKRATNLLDRIASDERARRSAAGSGDQFIYIQAVDDMPDACSSGLRKVGVAPAGAGLPRISLNLKIGCQHLTRAAKLWRNNKTAGQPEWLAARRNFGVAFSDVALLLCKYAPAPDPWCNR